MDEWQLDFEWLRIRHLIKDRFEREDLPNLNAILFLIGLQELGRWPDTLTKEEKQDLMHIAVCEILSQEGHYEFTGRDADGWPHYQVLEPVPKQNLKQQEELLKRNIVRYFRRRESEEE
jgi:hypothetical protein